MTITIAQLHILAEKYHFDIDDARLTIGLPPSSKRGRPVKVEVAPPQKSLLASLFPSVPRSGSMTTVTIDPSKVKCVGGKCANAPAKKPKKETADKPKVKRGPTGYNLYMSEVRPRVVSDIQRNLKQGEKSAPGAVMSEIGKRWKSLPESSRDIWNKKAAASM